MKGTRLPCPCCTTPRLIPPLLPGYLRSQFLCSGKVVVCRENEWGLFSEAPRAGKPILRMSLNKKENTDTIFALGILSLVRELVTKVLSFIVP